MLERRNIKLTEEVIELFEKGLRIKAAGDDQVVEGKGGRQAEFIVLHKKLHALLDLPRFPSLFDKALDRKKPPDYLRPEMQMMKDWAPAQRLRRALLEEVERRKNLAKAK